MYKVRDLQSENRYFADGSIFKDLKEVCEHLIEYHSYDCDMSVEQQLLDEDKIEECWDALSLFEWELVEVGMTIETIDWNKKKRNEMIDRIILNIKNELYAMDVRSHYDIFIAEDIEGVIQTLNDLKGERRTY